MLLHIGAFNYYESVIITALIISLIVIAINLTYQEGEIFGFVSKYGERLPEKLQKPLFSCPICQTPWYGGPIYLIGNYLNLSPFADIRIQAIAFVIVIAIGINTVYVNIKNE